MLTKEQLQDLINMLEIVRDRVKDPICDTLITACINILKWTVKTNSLAWKLWWRLGNKRKSEN